MALSNQEALHKLKNHKKLEEFLNGLDFTEYPSLDLKKVFYLISTGVLVENMSIESTCKFVQDAKKWLNNHKRGGVRSGAGRPKKNLKIVKLTLSAEEKAIALARKKAQSKGTSLQAMFRDWLQKLPNS